MAEEVETQEVSIDDPSVSQQEFKEARTKGVLTIEKPKDVEAEKPEEETKPEEGEKPKKSSGGFQKKIDRLIKHNATLSEELEATKKRAADLEAKTGKPAEVKPDADPEPKIEDFQTHELWVKAQARWEVRQEMKAQREQEAKDAEAARQKEVFDTYNAKVSEAQAKYDDWKEVVGQSVDLPTAVVLAVLEMENGPDVAYHLGKHPELRDQLLEMSNLKAIGKVWRISEELAGEKKEETEDDDKESEKVEAKPAKPVSKVPAPIKPVGGGSTKSSVPLDQLSMSEYKKARAAGRIQ
jgi:hypothetical protein